jgi:pSer/pThr/pTyr-binding forkhead associated (FHA) protein
MVWTNTEQMTDQQGMDTHNEGAEAAYGFYLEIILLEGGIKRFTLEASTPILIGRSPNHCQILLYDNRISRIHLQLICTAEQQIQVTDMHSANGSRLDGRTLQPGMPMTWLINQPIVIGGTHLILRYGALDD